MGKVGVVNVNKNLGVNNLAPFLLFSFKIRGWHISRWPISWNWQLRIVFFCTEFQSAMDPR